MLPDWLVNVFNALKPIGLNVVGVTDGRPHQSLLPDCQSAVVIGNGGTALWDHFIEDLKVNPNHLSQHQHPFDDFVKRSIETADPNPPKSRRWIRCAAEPEAFVDFRPLAESAGLGFSSTMGLLIHPEYGLWTGLRAVLLTTEKLPEMSAVQGESPCQTCTEQPCITACPAGAVQPTGWKVKICAKFHEDSQVCHGQCHSRLSCPVGAAHRHGPLQHQYHNARQSGRKALSEHLGVSDRFGGLDPNWSDWT